MNHTELCRLTAEKFVKTLAMYEVRGQWENPDVITWYSSGMSVVFEIKMSRADFLRDFKKPCRKEGRRKCGNFHAYVCNGDFIRLEEIPDGWGLYHFIDGHFKEIRRLPAFGSYDNESKDWACENSILVKHILGSKFWNKQNIVFNKRYFAGQAKEGESR